jgi:hypothetical protein
VTLCTSCVNRRFGGTYRPHLQGRKIHKRGTSVSKWQQAPKRWFTKDLHSATSQKTTFFIVTAVKTSKLTPWLDELGVNQTKPIELSPYSEAQEFLNHSRNSKHFIEPGSTLSCSHESATRPYPKPDESIVPGMKNKLRKNTTFRKLDLFPSSGEGNPYSVGSLRKS